MQLPFYKAVRGKKEFDKKVKKLDSTDSHNTLSNKASILDVQNGRKAGPGTLPNDKVKGRCGHLSKPKKNIIVATKRRKGRVVTSTFVGTSAEPNNFNGRIRHVELGKRIVRNPRPPLHKPVFTSTKVSMAGFTVSGIESETSFLERTWPVFAAKELMDNPYDWFDECYPNNSKQDRKISFRVRPIDIGIRIAVRNSNVDNIPVFQNLELTFDLSIWHSSKRNQHKGGTGALRDALKRIFKMGYASWTSGYNSQDSFIDRQWNEPIILTFNGRQHTAVLYVDKDNQDAKVIINRNYDSVIDISNDTEVSVALPTKYDYCSILDQLKQYYKIYKIPKRRIDFSFEEVQ